MNLKDFTRTDYRGLYLSKVAHPTFGKKYIARFQVSKKRYMKVLGFTIADKINDLKAFALMQKYKKSIIEKNNTPSKSTTKNTNKKELVVSTADCKDENILMKSLLKDYKNIDPTILEKGIQKIYDYEEMKQYQIELIKLQKHLEKTNKKMIILFEGRDASGKGGAIRRITRYMNSRHYRIVALGKPTDTQKNQWYFQKYIQHFPTGGEMILFDRSWYNRAMVEPVFGFCTPEQHEIFMEDVVNFEHDLVRQDIILIKLYFSVSKAEQLARFQTRQNDPLKQWKLSEVDLQAQDLWEEFSEKKYEMLRRTNSKSAPWHVIRSDDKHKSRIEAVKVILNSVDYDNRNYAVNFEADDNFNISVSKELARMRKKKDY
ncbi:MAG TPA: polyphosphate kinase 2 [Arcobacter sp.]|nr:polyphosphate kinase 2 [Arcobacter sp.]HIP55438.1 polyphosphate kinase 2 [Arcobacter sp.]